MPFEPQTAWQLARYVDYMNTRMFYLQVDSPLNSGDESEVNEEEDAKEPEKSDSPEKVEETPSATSEQAKSARQSAHSRLSLDVINERAEQRVRQL